LASALALLLRVYAYLFHLILSLFLLGLGVITITSGQDNLKLGMLPWEGSSLTRAIIVLGLTGILCILFAVSGRARWLFPLWCLFALGMMFRGYFLTSYTFGDAGHFKSAIWLTVGALVAFLGSLSLFGGKARSRK
jgi:hypothetical protein